MKESILPNSLRAAALSLSAALTAGLQAGEISSKAVSLSPTVEATTWGGPILGGGVKSNGDFTEGSLFLVQPLLNTIDGGSTVGGDVLFVEPYLTWGNGGEFGASLGLGYRHLFSSQTHEEAVKTKVAGFLTEGFFVGANTFLDFANTRNDSDFWQLGVGLEAGTRYLEVRANYYLPLSDESILDRRVSSTSNVRTTTSQSTGTVRRTTTGTTTRTTTELLEETKTTRTTTRTTTELFEETMEGFDIEAALLVPYVDRYLDVKLIGGFYDFQGDRSRASDFAGWRLGVEARPLASMVVFAHWYDRDNFYQDNWIAGVRFEIPLGANRKEGFTTRRRHLAERMFEPVRRQNSSITTSGTVEEVVSVDTTTSSTTQTRSVATLVTQISQGGSEEKPLQ
jgi:hypothetical protein